MQHQSLRMQPSRHHTSSCVQHALSVAWLRSTGSCRRAGAGAAQHRMSCSFARQDATACWSFWCRRIAGSTVRQAMRLQASAAARWQQLQCSHGAAVTMDRLHLADATKFDSIMAAAVQLRLFASKPVIASSHSVGKHPALDLLGTAGWYALR